MPIEKCSGSVSHAVNILLCLSNQIHTISEISRQCQLGKSTVHRVLKLLEQTGMVIQDPINRNYYLGPFIARLNANPYTSHEYLIIYILDEIVLHVCGNPGDPEDLGADIEFGVDNVPLRFARTTALFVPRGISHGPIICHEYRKPHIVMAIMCGAGDIKTGWSDSFVPET